MSREPEDSDRFTPRQQSMPLVDVLWERALDALGARTSEANRTALVSAVLGVYAALRAHGEDEDVAMDAAAQKIVEEVAE